jgi:hypothetical protein
VNANQNLLVHFDPLGLVQLRCGVSRLGNMCSGDPADVDCPSCQAALAVTPAVNADTLTEAQILELRADCACAPWIVTDTFVALTVGRSDMFWHPVTAEENRAARERLANIINATKRAK